ncbi:MAG TPA: TVP38/TMEM64 family protein [Rhodanobacteraceae bacterium]
MLPGARAPVKGGERLIHVAACMLVSMLSRVQWRWVLRVVLVLVALAAVVAFFVLGAPNHLNFETLQRSREWLSQVQTVHPWRLAFAFLAILIAIAALSLPLLTVMTLAAGAIFGVVEGTVLMSFGSAIGATLVMLATRFVFKDAVRKRFEHRLRRVDAGIERDGAFYLLNIRLVPIFPFFLVNLLMGLTHIPVFTFYWVTQIGMVVGIAVYVNAGTRIAAVSSPKGLVSLPLIISLALLAVLPFGSRWLVRRVRHWLATRWRWRRMQRHRERSEAQAETDERI